MQWNPLAKKLRSLGPADQAKMSELANGQYQFAVGGKRPFLIFLQPDGRMLGGPKLRYWWCQGESLALSALDQTPPVMLMAQADGVWVGNSPDLGRVRLRPMNAPARRVRPVYH